MASSGSVSTGGYGYRYLKCNWWVESTSIEKNQKVIKWELVGAGGDTYSYYTSGNFKVVIDGTTVYSSSTRINLYNGTVVATGTHTLTHDSNGNKSFEISVEAGIYYVAVNVKGRETFTLDQIKRNSVLGVISEFTMNEAITIPITKYSSSFTDTLEVSLNNTIIKTVSNITNGYSLSFTEAELSKIYNLLPNSRNGTFNFKLTTKIESTILGTSNKNAIGNIPTNTVRPAYPTFVVTEANTDVVPIDWGFFVRNKSKIKFEITAIAGEGATVSKVTTKIDGITYTGTSFETEIIKKSGDISVEISVTDSRNITSSKYTSINIVDYDKPFINSASAIRSDLGGVASNNGTYLKVSLNAGIYLLEGKNTGVFKVRYRKTTEESYKEYTLSSDGQTYDGYVRIPALDVNSSYEVQIVITDYFDETVKLLPNVPSSFSTVDYLAGGKGMAIGKVAEEENIFEVAFKTKLTGGLEIILLEDGADLNELTTHNFYKSKDSASANYSNCPISSGSFYLEVNECGNAGELKQTLINYDGSKPITYERFCYENTWCEWRVACSSEVVLFKNTSGEKSTIYLDTDVRNFRSLDVIVGIKGRKFATAHFDEFALSRVGSSLPTVIVPIYYPDYDDNDNEILNTYLAEVYIDYGAKMIFLDCYLLKHDGSFSSINAGTILTYEVIGRN